MVKDDQFNIVWREEKRRRCQKAGHTPSEALGAKRKKEFELAGRAVLQDGKQITRPKNGDFTFDPGAYLSLESANPSVPNADPVRV